MASFAQNAMHIPNVHVSGVLKGSSFFVTTSQYPMFQNPAMPMLGMSQQDMRQNFVPGDFAQPARSNTNCAFGQQQPSHQVVGRLRFPNGTSGEEKHVRS